MICIGLIAFLLIYLIIITNKKIIPNFSIHHFLKNWTNIVMPKIRKSHLI
ncbi:hypothetical protein VIBNISO65_1090032 [Vibrio nigripulchritudo SO65]|nr:hypothetical protein VIBNISO65_1090032 [Vibrio nigripulchritudo SO65]